MRLAFASLFLAVLFAAGSTAYAGCDFHTAKTDDRIATPSTPIVLPDEDRADG